MKEEQHRGVSEQGTVWNLDVSNDLELNWELKKVFFKY